MERQRTKQSASDKTHAVDRGSIAFGGGADGECERSELEHR
jgi:hypothetical protein